MTKSRRELIEEGFNKPPEQHSQAGIMLKVLEKHKDTHLPIGQGTAFLRAMSPLELGFHRTLYRRHLEAEDLGKHAAETTQDILDTVQAHPLVSKLIEGFDNDDVAMRLIARRGSDSNLEIPDMTRRDVLSSAVDAHSDQGEE